MNGWWPCAVWCSVWAAFRLRSRQRSSQVSCCWRDTNSQIAVLLASALALSSTAIVLEVLSKQGRLTTATGRASFAILLAQDLVVIPILMYVSILGADKGSSVLMTIALALLQATTAVALIILLARVPLRPLFRQVARTQ